MKIIGIKQTYPGEGDITFHVSQGELISLQIALERYQTTINVDLLPRIPQWAGMLEEMRRQLAVTGVWHG